MFTISLVPDYIQLVCTWVTPFDNVMSFIPICQFTEVEWRLYALITQVTIGSGNGLLPFWYHAISWTNDDLLLTGPLETTFGNFFLPKYNYFHAKKSVSKYRLKNCAHLLGLSVLVYYQICLYQRSKHWKWWIKIFNTLGLRLNLCIVIEISLKCFRDRLAIRHLCLRYCFCS